MERLPTEIIENILFRLDIEVALQAKRVCTTWKSLLRNYKSHKQGLLFALSYSHKVRHQLKYEDEYDHYDPANRDYYHTNRTLSKIQHSTSIMEFSSSRDVIVGSCNGLACLGKYIKGIPDHATPYSICNPLTGESVFLPEINYSELYRNRIPRALRLASGFGYCPSTNDYKVVAICYSWSWREHKGHVQLHTDHVLVYTVGSGEWRSIESNNSGCTFKNSSGIYANGALYWLHLSDLDRVQECQIVALDLESEKFYTISLPVSIDIDRRRSCILSPPLRLVGGNDNLYLVHINRGVSGTDICVYKMNSIGDAGASHDMKKSSCWIKDMCFRIHCKASYYCYDVFEPFTITRNNQVLMWCNRHESNWGTLYCYEPKTSTVDHLWDNNAKHVSNIEAIPHMQTLVSLKDLGEPNVIYFKDLEEAGCRFLQK